MIGIIPAAGKGTRLRPITDAIPKELLMCGSKTLIEHGLESMNACGIDRSLIITGHKKGTLMDFVKDGHLHNIDIDFVYQTEMGGLGHAILCCKNKIRDPTLGLMVILGDTVIEPKQILKNMIKIHKSERPLATILLHEVEDPKLWGVVKLKEIKDNLHLVTDIFEKPQTETEQKPFEFNGKYFASIGIYCLDQKIFEYIEKTPKGRNNEVQLTDAMQVGIDNGEQIIGLKHTGTWLDIGSPATYLQAQWAFFKDKTQEDITKLAEEWNSVAEKINK
ncbi:MAG: nucleotidyltransferase family protein [DPANN group archaeon]|nr:nucleotidyltransferase family protein [DPANN group archaeon]